MQLYLLAEELLVVVFEFGEEIFIVE